LSTATDFLVNKHFPLSTFNAIMVDPGPDYRLSDIDLLHVILCGIGIQIESRNYVKVYIGPRSLGRFARFAFRNVTYIIFWRL
jgi:hypothetical protein